MFLKGKSNLNMAREAGRGEGKDSPPQKKKKKRRRRKKNDVFLKQVTLSDLINGIEKKAKILTI